VSVESALAGRSVSVVLPDVANRNLTVSEVGFSLSDDNSQFDLSVSAQDTRPASVSKLSGATTVGYIQVEPQGVTDEQISSGTFRLDIPNRVVTDAGGTPEDVVVYRFNDGEWQALETQYTGASYLVESPGFSVFAVAIQQQTTPTPTTTPTATPTPTPTATPGDTPTSTATTTTTSPGFGAVVALIALLAVALLARRQQ
jgi:PGF-CTERM protein/PGF-pre-PGF domain-containing protein